MQKINRKKRNEDNLKNVKNFLHSLFMSHSPSFLSKQNNMIYLLLEKGVTKCEKYNLYKESTRNYSTAIIIWFKLMICLEIISTNALKAIMCFTFTFTLCIPCWRIISTDLFVSFHIRNSLRGLPQDLFCLPVCLPTTHLRHC